MFATKLQAVAGAVDIIASGGTYHCNTKVDGWVAAGVVLEGF